MIKVIQAGMPELTSYLSHLSCNKDFVSLLGVIENNLQ